MKLLGILILALMIAFCSHKEDRLKPPARVKGVPEKAFWVGGVDGGNWYVVDYIHPHRNNAVIKVYSDHDGSLIVSKQFILICAVEDHMIIENLQEQIDFFDGEKINLISPDRKSSCYLK